MKQKGEFLQSVLKKYIDCIVFLHNTHEAATADKILSEGFIFENQLSHTSDRVNPSELIELSYFLFLRKDYGPYTIIIAIPKNIYELYTRYSNRFETTIEDLMTKTIPWMGENDEYLYMLAPEHIAGYFNNDTLEFTENQLYKSEYLAYRDRDDF